MKNLSLLKLLITILYTLLVTSFILGLVTFVYSAIPDIVDYVKDPSIFEGREVDWYSLSTIFGGFVLYTLVIRGIHFLKAILPILSSGNLFHMSVSERLMQAGKYFVVAGIVVIFVKLFFLVLGLSHIETIIDVYMLGSIFLIIIGVFFLFFGEAFHNARLLQEENDLTI